MIHLRRVTHEVSESLVREVASRDAALWIGRGLDESPGRVESLRRLIQLPWRFVLCEPDGYELAESIQGHVDGPSGTRSRGFLHLIASDPEGLELPPRSLPIYFLNGRQGSSDQSEAVNLGRNAGLRRRLNMIQRLEAAKPRQLVVVSNEGSPLDDALDLWTNGFRAILTVVSDEDRDADLLDGWVSARGGVVEQCRMPFEAMASDLASKVEALATSSRVVIRMQVDAERLADVDVTECDLIQQPLLDKYHLIQSRDLRAMLPEELPQETFQSFFEKSSESWVPYAAGLPWGRDDRALPRVLAALRGLSEKSDESNPLLVIASQSGAGGTTFARSLAHGVAREGFPTLVARDIGFRPDFTDVESFLYRVRQEVLSQFWRGTEGERDVADAEEPAEPFEVPWLIVFDVEHWKGRESALRGFVRDLARRGRPAVVLTVSPPQVPEELRASGRAPCSPTRCRSRRRGRSGPISTGS